MFYYLDGVLSEIGPNLAVIDCSGIGFAVNTTMNTLSKMEQGDLVRLYISEAIGESNFDLYGFFDKSEKRCFEMLLSVSGIGPKAALSILSSSSPEALALAIMSNDVKALTLAPGVGKKIAQRVILELKDKISKEMGGAELFVPGQTAASAPVSDQSQVNDAVAALAVLGYSSAEVAPVLKTLDLGSMNAEAIIKAVLKQMVK